MTTERFRFGNCTLCPATRELSRDGERVVLAAKSFDCLAYLFRHRDRAVSRDELISAVWGRTNVSDGLLTQTLWRARKALGDAGEGQPVLRTVPRFGYQWVATVQPVRDAREAAANPVAAAGTPARRSNRLVWFVAAAALSTVVTVFAYRISLRSSVHDGERRVLVMPAGIDDDGAETAWLRLGAMEDIATLIRDHAHVDVVPSEDAVALARGRTRWSAADLERLARLAGASDVLAPKFSRDGDDWTLTLDAWSEGETASVQANARSPLVAAGSASERYFARFGVAVSLPAGADEALARIDAALLAGNLAEARALIGPTRDVAALPAGRAIRAGRAALRSGDIDEAARIYDALRGRADLPASDRVDATIGLGEVAIRRRAYAQALAVYDGLIDGARLDLSRRQRADAWLERGIVNGGLARYDAALEDFARARVAFDRLGDHLKLAALETDVAMLEASRSRFAEAAASYERAAEIFERFGVRDSLAIVLANKVGADLAALDTAAALADSARAWPLVAEEENRIVVDFVAARRARALLAGGELSAAAALIDRFMDRDDADPDFAVLRARLLVEKGESGQALALADTIFDRIEEASDERTCRALLPGAAMVLADAAMRAGVAEALARLRSRIDALGGRNAAYEGFAMTLADAEGLAASRDRGADGRFAAALELADRSAQPDSVVAAGAAYARYLLARPDAKRATGVVGRLMPYVAKDYRAAAAVARLAATLGDLGLAREAGVHARRLAGEREIPAVP